MCPSWEYYLHSNYDMGDSSYMDKGIILDYWSWKFSISVCTLPMPYQGASKSRAAQVMRGRIVMSPGYRNDRENREKDEQCGISLAHGGN